MITTLKRRPEFLRVRGGGRATCSAFVLEGKARPDMAPKPTADGTTGPRIGYTVTRKVGNAVVRNRIKRRLREAVREVFPRDAQPGFDYVLIARNRALQRRFKGLVADLREALRRVHAPRDNRPKQLPPGKSRG